jgi:hypothetical protein
MATSAAATGPGATAAKAAGRDEAAAVSERIWLVLRRQGEEMLERDALLGPLVRGGILDHATFEEALLARLAYKLAGQLLDSVWWTNVSHPNNNCCRCVCNGRQRASLASRSRRALEHSANSASPNVASSCLERNPLLGSLSQR